MDFKKMPLKTVLAIAVFAIMFITVLLWKLSSKTDITPDQSSEISAKPVLQVLPDQTAIDASLASKEEDLGLEEQLERDRQEQRETKYLKTKLEQPILNCKNKKLWQRSIN